MANRDDNWRFEDRERGRGWPSDERRGERSWRGRPDEGRAFEERDAQFDADRNRYRARFDRDRTGYRGQEYGVEGGREHQRDREGWRADEARDRRGIERFGQPADYAYRPGDHEFEPDYVSWRDEQMRGHDRDYADWRRAQHEQYDNEYRRFRAHRRSSFGETFQGWRAQQSAVGGVKDTSVAPGVSYAGERSTHSGGYTGGYERGDSQKPSGMPDPSLNMSGDPAMSQTGAGAGQAGGGNGQHGAGAGGGAEFGKAPAQVQAAAEGSTGRRDAEERKADKDARRDDKA